MKYVALWLTALFAVTPSLAQSTSGFDTYGAEVKCEMKNGTIRQIPKDLCQVYGGKQR